MISISTVCDMVYTRIQDVSMCCFGRKCSVPTVMLVAVPCRAVLCCAVPCPTHRADSFHDERRRERERERGGSGQEVWWDMDKLHVRCCRVYRHYTVRGSCCESHPCGVEGEAADRSDSLTQEPIVILNNAAKLIVPKC
jgi:hypothetical protein